MSMSNKLTLDEKRLLRSIADLTTNRPLVALSFFTSVPKTELRDNSVLLKISNIVDLIKNNEKCIKENETEFFNMLHEEIQKIRDSETRTIFESSYGSAIDERWMKEKQVI
ncbi:TPA: hypothetical protein NJ106_003482 [Vibrio parahaemolyticus]|nr:hypothetical protein [Vibrio parahaemolyticus]